MMIRLASLLLVSAIIPMDAQPPSWKEQFAHAQAGDATAQLQVGLGFLKGVGVSKDEASARQWLAAAAQQGNAEAQAALGYLLAAGKGGPKDREQAILWLRKASDQNWLPARHNLAVCLLQGSPDEVTAALVDLQSAADAGYTPSRIRLGEIYLVGEAGIKPDEAKALACLRPLAEKGDPAAQNGLGILFEHGASPNLAEAVKWYTAAARQDNAKAQNNLGRLYASGQGVNRDTVTACYWFLLGKLNGEIGAALQFSQLSHALTPSQIEELNQRVRQFKDQRKTATQT